MADKTQLQADLTKPCPPHQYQAVGDSIICVMCCHVVKSNSSNSTPTPMSVPSQSNSPQFLLPSQSNSSQLPMRPSIDVAMRMAEMTVTQRRYEKELRMGAMKSANEALILHVKSITLTVDYRRNVWSTLPQMNVICKLRGTQTECQEYRVRMKSLVGAGCYVDTNSDWNDLKKTYADSAENADALGVAFAMKFLFYCYGWSEVARLKVLYNKHRNTRGKLRRRRKVSINKLRRQTQKNIQLQHPQTGLSSLMLGSEMFQHVLNSNHSFQTPPTSGYQDLLSPKPINMMKFKGDMPMPATPRQKENMSQNGTNLTPLVYLIDLIY